MTKPLNEDELLRKIAGGAVALRASGLRMGIGDDTAIWRPRRGFETILTCDWSLEGSHFLLDKHPADAIGWKAMARATSDIAAMGGVARCFLLNLALPAELTGTWLTGFLGGVRRASRKFGCAMAGGDTTRSAKALVNITVVGEVRPGEAVLRSGARPGDGLFVSGRLGEADLGLRELRKARGFGRPSTAALRKHLYPEPRLELGRWLAERRMATAMMDLSDGLSTDLRRMCAASRTGAVVEAEELPLVDGKDREDALQLALHGGDDYELLFTARGGAKVPKSYRGVAIRKIGVIQKQKKILVKFPGGSRELVAGGWDPFRK